MRQRVAEGVKAVKTAVKSEVATAIVQRWEPTAARLAVVCGVAGILGSLSMFVGDVLLYGPAALGEPASTYFKQVDPVASPADQLASSLMGVASSERTVAGGLLGPLAAVLYIIGSVQMLLAAIPFVSVHGRLQWSSNSWRHRLGWGVLACSCHCAMFVFVGTYHAAFAYTAILSRAELGSLRGEDGCQGLECGREEIHLARF
jgi:hypothetical protein